MHVPAAPTDGGITAGAVWAHAPPPSLSPTLPLITALGPAPPDLADLPALAARHGAARVRVTHVAAALARGAVVALMRGGCEVGPRPTGRRAVLARATSDTRARLYAALGWQAFRAPQVAVLAEAAADVLDGVLDGFASPAMAFTVPLRPATRARLWDGPNGSSSHGAAVVQTVMRGGWHEKWLRQLLEAEGKATGSPGMLLHFPFAAPRRPYVNRVGQAVRLFLQTEMLDYLVVEDWMFCKPVGVPCSVRGLRAHVGPS